LTACIGCGCSNDAACLATSGKRCFWTWLDDDQTVGLCSFCAGIPLDDLVEKIRIQQETILYADAMRRAATAR